ncbi:hypothetical protein GLOIN_2v1787415 [Rhizophagus clarus]|uniref:RNase H type-1 domain-containing protein n=1 Tax=Rhizophagus clarus TaxID=94130 RepID=A0A8H3QIB3_9GLOM|nr:hypothetical protein GLOIN_2v1787415 [Rhizophagus clarus]
MKINNFDFYQDKNSLQKFKILGGPTIIQELLTNDQYHHYFPFFKKHNLIFIDQLTSLCKNFLLLIFELKEKRYTSYIKVTPATKKLYDNFTKILCNNQKTLELKDNIKNLIAYKDITHNLKGSITIHPFNSATDKGKIAIFDIEDVLEMEEIVFRKIFKIDLKLLLADHLKQITDDYEKGIVFKTCPRCYRGHKGLKGLDMQEEYIQALFGIRIYSNNDIFLAQYISTFDSWITSTKAETLAFLVTLLILPENANAMIYLDSETVYNNYYNLINTTNIISIRDLFKTQHNPSLWIIIKDLLRHYKHNLTLVKIKAHTINSRHNEVDAYIKNSHNNINDIFPTNLSFSHLDTSNFIPTWNNYIIETNLRRFIRLTTRIYSLEKFFNLNRNSKYHMLDLQWDITFEYINSQTEDETYFTTNHFLHKVKWQKIQRLIEELPTIEHLKKSLITKHNLESDSNTLTTFLNSQPDFQLLSNQDQSTFSFIELIKGIINDIFQNSKKLIWTLRCEKLKDIEKKLKITKKMIRMRDSKNLEEKCVYLQSASQSLTEIYENMEGVTEHIKFGAQILDFTMCVGQIDEYWMILDGATMIATILNLQNKITLFELSEPTTKAINILKEKYSLYYSKVLQSQTSIPNENNNTSEREYFYQLKK